jgi:hypothetical protein
MRDVVVALQSRASTGKPCPANADHAPAPIRATQRAGGVCLGEPSKM